MSISGSDGTRILDGVGCLSPANFGPLCFPGALGAAMRYLCEETPTDVVLGISGGAFKTFWLPPWALSNCDLLCIGEEPIRRAFAALGYGYTWLPDYNRAHPLLTREFCVSAITTGINAGRPVIAIGVIGPPEACLITGYERDGEVLHGTSYFQGLEGGFFRMHDWYPALHGLLLIGERGPKPPAPQVLRDSLEWAIHLARTPSFGDQVWRGDEETPRSPQGQCTFRHWNGLAAYDAMAEMMERDEEFEDLSPQDVELRSFAAGHDGVVLLNAERAAAAAFLEGFGRGAAPGLEPLERAAEAYRQETRVLECAMEAAPLLWFREDRLRHALEPEPRRTFAGLVREARDWDERAVGHLERALETM